MVYWNSLEYGNSCEDAWEYFEESELLGESGGKVNNQKVNKI
jgi:hypothetical protein